MKKHVYPLLKLALPLMLTGLVQSSVWFFETLFLSHVSYDALAAGSLVSWAFNTVVMMLFGVLSSINILIAHKFGAEDEQGIFQIVHDGFWLAILLSMPIFLLFWNMPPLLLYFGQSPAIVMLAKSYLHAMVWGILPTVIIIALLEICMGLGQARIILLFNIFSVSLTVFLSFALIFGKFGLPKLGIVGAGWGLTISNWISGIALSVYALHSSQYKRYFCYLFKFNKPSYLIELLHIGIPMGLIYCLEIAFFFALTLIMGSFGSIVMAANQIALQYLGALMAIVFSLAQAITVRMGHLLGANKIIAAQNTAYIGIYLATLFMLLVALCYYYFPSTLISIDFDVNEPKNAKIVYFATQFLFMSAIFQVLEAICIALFGALRALKDMHFILLISILSFWGIALPTGYLMATRLPFGATGLWWGMILAASLSIVLLLWRFQYKIARY